MFNRNNLEPFYVACLIIIGFLVFVEAIIYSNFSNPPEKLNPGDSVAILTGKTILQDGKPCQENSLGFISPTGPNGENSWYQAERYLFPTAKTVAVISSEGVVSWHPERRIAKLPATAEQLVCSIPK